MKTTELRIGNYFHHEETLVDVSIIHRTHFYCESIDGISHGNSFQENFQPIPLTEEWLLKFGFNKEENAFYYPYKAIFITINLGKYPYIGLCRKEDYALTDEFEYIKYVHQLQNLYFALTGNELEIKL